MYHSLVLNVFIISCVCFRDLKNNSMTTIGPTMFGGTTSSINTLNLQDNLLEVLEEGTFDTASINHLFLDNNEFVIFPGGALGTAAPLQTL